jgi:circadian clock protein KaiC
MTAARELPQRHPTGVAGLDQILDGGLLTAGVYIVQGPPGAGKTILANQILFNHARSGGQSIYVTLLAESHARMFSHLRRLEFFDEEKIPHFVYYVGGFSALEAEGLSGLLTLLRGLVTKRSATVAVIDGLVSAHESSGSDREFKKFLHEVQVLADLTRCTMILLTNAERTSGFFPEHTMVDGVMHLTDELSELRPLRHIRVLKLRGSAPVRGLHSVRITDAGFEVQPRLETRPSATSMPAPLSAAGVKRAFGIPELDEMLRGGVFSGSITMLLGASGTGKTLLSLHFLSEGARQGERVLYFGFYENPAALLTKCERLGLDPLVSATERGDARIVWHRPVEGVVDELGKSLFEEIRRLKPTRLVIDGIQGFEQASEFPSRSTDIFDTIANELERLGITTLYTAEIPALFDGDLQAPFSGLSAATQNIVVLRHVEQRGSVVKALAIFKIRDDGYDPAIREVEITQRGIRLLDSFGSDASPMTGDSVVLKPAHGDGDV